MTTRTDAMKWWNSLPDYATEDVLHKGKHGLCTNHHGSRTWQSLTGREIENIWNKEKETMGNVKKFVNEIEAHLFDIYSAIGMDRPENHDQILEFISNDVMETADPKEWHSGDVGIAFRRWIEAQAKDEDESENIWSEIRNDFEDDDYINIDAWVTGDDNEDGRVIAKVRISDNEVTYIDQRAKSDKYAQEVITECFNRL